VKETHRESTNLQALATTSEDRDVTCFCNETNDPIDICAIDALHRATEIVHDAREQAYVRVHDIPVSIVLQIARRR
jgi:hypothetical protein